MFQMWFSCGERCRSPNVRGLLLTFRGQGAKVCAAFILRKTAWPFCEGSAYGRSGHVFPHVRAVVFARQNHRCTYINIRRAFCCALVGMTVALRACRVGRYISRTACGAIAGRLAWRLSCACCGRQLSRRCAYSSNGAMAGGMGRVAVIAVQLSTGALVTSCACSPDICCSGICLVFHRNVCVAQVRFSVVPVYWRLCT